MSTTVTITSGSSWARPSDCPSVLDLVECWGGGQPGETSPANQSKSAAESNTARPKAVPCVRACYAAVNAERIVQAVQAMAQCVITLHEAGVAGTAEATTA